MGMRNRERRAVKAQKRSSGQKTRRPTGLPRHPRGPNPFLGCSAEEIARTLVGEAVQAVCRDDDVALRVYVDALAERPGDDQWRVDVDRAAFASCVAQVGVAWRRGWQPADLTRWVRRDLGAIPALMLIDLIAAQLRHYRAQTIHPRWAEQLAAFPARVWWGEDDQLLAQWETRHGLVRHDVLEHLVRLTHQLRCAPDIGRVGPLPGEARRGDHSGGFRGDPRVLDRVRALLAKAESTEFAEEAEALTAKAQQLMTRHSIDDALLAADSGGGPASGSGGIDEPEGIRVGIDNPYEAAKSLLLQQVAEANRCRAVWSKSLGFTTVVGFPADLEAVELLYTSLLVQATSVVVQAGARRDGSGRSRTRSFRQSFLTAFAVRIGERLRSASADASREAVAQEGSQRLLPVLAAREDRVRAKMSQLFPQASSSTVRIVDREGWASGRAAADLARLQARQAVAVD